MRRIDPGGSAARPVLNSFWPGSFHNCHHRARPGDRKRLKGGFVPLPVPGTSPTVGVQSRNDFPLFQATVLLAGHAFLVISGFVPAIGSGTAGRP